MKTHHTRILFATLLFCVLATSVRAQLIISDPPLPTEQDQVVITFNATLGSGGLAGYTGDVYAHTGVITNLSTSGSDWKYVVASWGVNVSKAKLQRIGPDLYTLTIGPNIRQYYGVAANETILRMAFVFRSAEQVGGRWLEGKTSSSGDIFYDVYSPGLNVVINSPSRDGIYVPGQKFTISAASNISDSLVLTQNKQRLTAVAGKQLTFDYTAANFGMQWLKVTAKKGNETVSDSVNIFVRTSSPVATLPPGVRSGINYINDNTVTLVLHDPPAKKEFVFVIGDFNNWQIDQRYYMNRTPDGQFFWITIGNLEKGKEYIYQYYVDGKLRLADPYTEKVSDPWNDKNISSTTFPGLIAYPAGKTTGIASVLQTARQPYQWQVTNFTPPAKQDLIIYELHIRDFVATRDIKTVTDTLNYLQKLGVNVVELMPINEFEGNDSWGYNASFYFAADKAYGRKQDYQRFIDECHKRGIAVVIDMVLNHSYGLSPMVQMYFDSNSGKPSADNPWFNQTCPHEPYCWGYDFNHHSQFTRDFVDRVNAFWLTEFKVDGFRFDFTKGFTNVQTSNQGSTYDAPRIAILKRMANKIWEINPKAYVILEHFADNSEERELAEAGMMTWGNTNYNFSEASMGWVDNSNFSWISYKQRGWTVPHLVGYMESHDEERLMYRNLQFGNSTNAAHNVKDLTIALKRQELAHVFFLAVPGPKMIWQFGELGYDVSIDFNGRLGAKPIRWNYLADSRRRYLYDVISTMTKLRITQETFRNGDFILSLSGPAKKIKFTHPAMNAIVMGNFGVTAGSIVPEFHNAGWWYDYFRGDSISVTDVNAILTLQPGEYRIYTSKRLVKPGIATTVHETRFLAQSALKILSSAGMNQHNLQVNLDKQQEIALEVFDLAGRRVAKLASGRFNQGVHTFIFNNDHENKPGIYIVRLITPAGQLTRKLSIL